MNNETNTELKNKIKEMIKSSKVFLFMKGNPENPECGFSAQVVHILNHFKIEFKSFNVLSNDDIRQGIKSYANWPTIPQLYINEKFIGGCDIVTQLAKSDKLPKLIEK